MIDHRVATESWKRVRFPEGRDEGLCSEPPKYPVVAESTHARFFPYDSPYANQREAISGVYDALENDRDVLFEGACGTGKTLAALVPALAFARETDKTVAITTNVHQQTRQFIEEARAIRGEEPIRAAVFRGKASMCHIDVGYEECEVLRDATTEVVDLEEDKRELEERQGDLLERAQAGDDSATEARSAVMDELQTVEADLEDLRDQPVCEHYYENLTADTDDFYQWLYGGVRTPEEIYDYAEREGLCGYELLKDGMEGVDLVVCNYHHLLDPVIREVFFRWLGRDPEDVIPVFDEAHNVERTAREHATCTLAEPTLDSALAELEEVDDSRATQAQNAIGAFREALLATYDEELGFGARERVGEDWEDLSIAKSEGRDDLTLAFLSAYEGQGIDVDTDAALSLGTALDRQYDRAYRDGETDVRRDCQTLQAAAFIETWLADGASGTHFPVLSVRRGSEGVYGRAELYACIPRAVTQDLFEEVHSTVLMSATLRPFDVTADVLGLEDPATMAFDLSFPEERRRTYAIETPALFASAREDPATQETIADTLRDVIEFTPGNSLLFFPSYSEAERYHRLLEGTTDSTLHLDQAGVSAEGMRQEFVASKDATLFTSLWGTLTEGVSFDGEDARTVAVVGVPYPYLDDRLRAVESAYGEAFGDGGGSGNGVGGSSGGDDDAGWRYAVEIPTIRKTRQALGRVLRSPEDFGARLLLDERYTERATREMGKYAVRDTFPPEERAEIVDVAPDKLKFALLNFYGDMDAYDGPPPAP